MASRYIEDPKQNLYYKFGSNAIFKIQGGSTMAAVNPKTQQDKPAKGETELLDPLRNNSMPWQPWGVDNMFPQNVMNDLRKNTVGKRALNFRTRVHMGTDLRVFEWYRDTKEIIKIPLQKDYAQIEDMFELHQIKATQKQVISNLETFHNAFPEILLDVSGGLYSYKCHKSVHCRLEKPDDNGRINNAYISLGWPYPSESYYDVVPLYNPKKLGQQDKFIMHLMYTGSDDTPYYELADWDSVRQNGWMDIAAMVPAMKKAIFNNSATLKYHIEIPRTYWEGKYPGFNQMPTDERSTLIETELDAFTNLLFNIESSGKSIISHFDIDENDKKEYGHWKISEIKNTLNDGEFNPDSKNANSEVCFAIGVAPPLIGLLPGASETGSGSNINELFWVLQSTMSMDREVSLQPLYVMKRLFNWNPKAQFDYVDTIRDKTTNNATKEVNLGSNAN